MARKPRVEYAGAIYHVMNRGDRREPIFKDDKDHQIFLDTLAQACEKTGWQAHAWCLMGNHFHLVIETPQANLVAGMKWFLGTYTMRFNRRHKLSGHLFSGRYKALVVDGSGSSYLRTVCDYVHLNPVRAGRIKKGQALAAYRWSSFPDYLKTPRQRPNWMRVDRLFGETGIRRDDIRGREEFEEQLEKRRGQILEEQWQKIRRGWWLGGSRFRAVLLERMEGKISQHHSAEERRESAEAKGKRIIEEALAQARWTHGQLTQRRKSDPVKVALAEQLRRETTVTLKWIAEQLQMGTWEYVSRLLYLRKTQKGEYHKVKD